MAVKKRKIISNFREITLRFLSVNFVTCLSWVGVHNYIAHPITIISIIYLGLIGILYSVGISYFLAQFHPLSPRHRKLIDQLLLNEDKIDTIKFMSTHIQLISQSEVIQRYLFSDDGMTQLRQIEKDEFLLVFEHESSFKWNRNNHYEDDKVDGFGRNIVLDKKKPFTKL